VCLGIETTFDQVNCLVVILALHRQFSRQHYIGEHANTPHITLQAIVANNNLGRNIIQSADAFGHATVEFVLDSILRRILKTNELNLAQIPLFRNQKILCLYISVANATLM
jgi:hypothetical protein